MIYPLVNCYQLRTGKSPSSMGKLTIFMAIASIANCSITRGNKMKQTYFLSIITIKISWEVYQRFDPKSWPGESKECWLENPWIPMDHLSESERLMFRKHLGNTGWKNPPTLGSIFRIWTPILFCLVNHHVCWLTTVYTAYLLVPIPLNPHVSWNHHHPSLLDCFAVYLHHLIHLIL